MTNGVAEWSGRFAEVALNFILPGLGGLIFDRVSRKNAIWQIILSIAGMVLGFAGLGIAATAFVDGDISHMDEASVTKALQDPEKVYQLLMGVAGIIFGGILLFGGFMWSLDCAMRRWRSSEVEPPDLPELPEEK